jgi:hypothetical protein
MQSTSDSTKKAIVRAIRSVDIAEYLDLGSSELSCIVCGRALTEGTVGGLKKRAGQALPFCDRPSCLRTVQQGVYQ